MASKMQRISDAEYTSSNTFILTTISELASLGLMLLTYHNYRHTDDNNEESLVNIIK